METSLQEIYDSFQAKIDEDLTGKESLIFQYFKAALSKCKKTVNHSLLYSVNDLYEGNFNETLDQDEIELIALNMLKERKRKRIEYLEGLERGLGTKDFNNLPDKPRELAALREGMKNLDEEIKELKQEFNTYKYK